MCRLKYCDIRLHLEGAAVFDRDRQVQFSVRIFADLGATIVGIFIPLYIVKEAKHVRCINFVKEAQPGEVIGLMYGNYANLRATIGYLAEEFIATTGRRHGEQAFLQGLEGGFSAAGSEPGHEIAKRAQVTRARHPIEDFQVLGLAE
jgi:hypothetical protein